MYFGRSSHCFEVSVIRRAGGWVCGGSFFFFKVRDILCSGVERAEGGRVGEVNNLCQ